LNAVQSKPRDLADIVSEAFRVCRANPLQLAFLAAATQLFPYAMMSVIWRMSPDWEQEEWGNVDVASIVALVAITVVSSMILGALLEGALIHAVKDHYRGQPVDVARVLGMSWRRIPALLGIALLVGLPIGALTLTIIGIPLAVYLGTRWFFSPQAVILEDKGPIGALSRSSALVKGGWWRTFGILISVWLIAGAISGVLSFTVGFIPWIGPFLALLVAAPISAVGITILYYDLVFRQSGEVAAELADS
jgi:hypothetical protein